MLCLLALLFALSHAQPSRYWFETPLHITSAITEDFRGCYGNKCLYVAQSPRKAIDSKLFSYPQPYPVWAVASNDSLVLFLSSPERPLESSNTLFISPVPTSRLLEASFDATPYVTADPDPIIVKLLEAVNADKLKEEVTYLADTFFTRNSYSPDAVDAADYLQKRFTELGCENAHQLQFRSGYSPNVVCELRGTNTALPPVVLGAHYDSRSTSVSSPTQRAPGADDNGTGTSAVLNILRLIVELRKNESFLFKKTIVFALFSGEEQGLVGSSSLAAEYKRTNTALTAMVNIDMIGYPQANAPKTLYWMSGSVSKSLTDLAFELTKLYLGADTVVAPTNACCSDQQSFHSQGYAAAGIFESLSATNNPNYHQSSDLPSTVNYEHVARSAKSALALFATLAEPLRG